jgi:alpha-glucosidase
MTVVHADAALLVFVRTLGVERIICAFNCSDAVVAVPAGLLDDVTPVEALNGATASQLPPYAALLAR